MKSINLFLLLVAICLTYSCNTKNENTSQAKDTQAVQSDIDEIALQIANSPAYILLDSLQAEMNIECRMAYNEYLINRKENNFAEILKIYQSDIQFPEKRVKLQKLGINLPQKLEAIAAEIQRTSTKLSEEFPVLVKSGNAELIKKLMTIKPQSGLGNPLNIKL